MGPLHADDPEGADAVIEGGGDLPGRDQEERLARQPEDAAQQEHRHVDVAPRDETAHRRIQL